MKIKLEATYYTTDDEPYMRVDLTSWDRWSWPYKLYWLAKCWRRLDLKLTVEKKARRR